MQKSPENTQPISEEELNNKLETYEYIESPREVIRSEMNELLRDAKKQNEGASGIIIKIEADSFSPKLNSALEQLGIQVNEETAAKLLKIYEPGSIAKEFQMQRSAYNAIEKASENNDKLAKIPDPFFYSDISVDQDTADNLRAQGIKLGQNNSVEIMLMDWIPGEDLVTQLYKKALEFFPEHPAFPDNTNDFQQLRSAVAVMLGFEAPDLTAADPVRLDSNKALTHRRNLEKLMNFLNSKNLKISPAVATQIENSIQVLHQNGIWHNDLHERNIDIVGDIFDTVEPGEIQSFIIDFGAATNQAPDRALSDSYLLDLLHENNAVEVTFEEKFAEMKQSIEKDRNYQSTFEMILVAIKHNPENGIQACFSLFHDDSGYKTFIALDSLISQNYVSKVFVREKCDAYLNNPNIKRLSFKRNLKEYIETLTI